MNPYLPKRKRHRAPKGAPRPAAAVFDYWLRPGQLYGGSVIAVQLHFLSTRCGAEATHVAARRVWDLIDREAHRRHLSVTYIADEFKLVVKQKDGLLLNEAATATIQVLLRNAMAAVGVDRA